MIESVSLQVPGWVICRRKSDISSGLQGRKWFVSPSAEQWSVQHNTAEHAADKNTKRGKMTTITCKATTSDNKLQKSEPKQQQKEAKYLQRDTNALTYAKETPQRDVKRQSEVIKRLQRETQWLWEAEKKHSDVELQQSEVKRPQTRKKQRPSCCF